MWGQILLHIGAKRATRELAELVETAAQKSPALGTDSMDWTAAKVEADALRRRLPLRMNAADVTREPLLKEAGYRLLCCNSFGTVRIHIMRTNTCFASCAVFSIFFSASACPVTCCL